MMSEENKAVVRRWADEVVNQGKLDLVDELFAEDFNWVMPFNPEPLHGPEAMKQTVTTFRTAFPDLRIEIEELVAEGDKVVAKYTASGTNDGEMMGSPPTGKPARWGVIHLITFRDGMVADDVTVME